MDAQRWQQLKQLLAEAGERPLADRQRFLDEHCPDRGLRAEVLDLLAADARLTDLIAREVRTVIAPGSHLGHYEIGDLIGRGGMGVVYRARDLRLLRDVAVKVLPSALTADPDRLARLRHEARLLASLNHPHICAIHQLEETDGVSALILELIEGETLADRLRARGEGKGLPLDETIRLARQVVDALDTAHQRGIVHRDLKPANIKITPGGAVKVLDFGLGKLTSAPGEHALTMGTVDGAVLGTVGYMSPEQARGLPVDKRTDVWAFGCVLFDMLTGRQAFGGKTASDVIASVLSGEPDWTVLPVTTPNGLRRLLRRCLEKDRERRLRDIADARCDLEDDAPVVDTRALPPSPGWRREIVAVAIGLAALVGIWFASGRLRSPAPESRGPALVGQFTVSLRPDEALVNLDMPAVAMSADGRLIAFVGGDAVRRLYVRAIDELTARAVPGTEGASSPFFSPDGRTVAFFSAGAIKTVSVDGGDPVVVCACGASNPRGGAWSADGTIAFAPAPGTPLFRVPAIGGTRQPLTTLAGTRGEGAHHWPAFMPDGKAVLYSVGTGAMSSWDEREIVVQSLATGARRTVAHGTAARYVDSGHLVVARGGALLAIPFDAARLEPSGPPVRIAEGVVQSAFGAAQFDVSRTGTIVSVPGDVIEREIISVTRDGAIEPLPLPRRTYWSVRRSPDDRRLALGVEAANYGVWIYDLPRATMTRLTFDGTNAWPIWTPDGRRVTYNSTRSSGVLNLFWRAADGSGDDERLATSDVIQIPDSWSPDGRYLAYQNNGAGTGRDIWILDRTGAQKPWPFVRTQFDEGGAAFSPDGRWIAYVSTESGTRNVFVRSFDGTGEKWQISTEGGAGPVWATDHRQLFYMAGRRMMVVDIDQTPMFHAGLARVLFEAAVEPAGFQQNYDVSADGQRFYMIRSRGPAAPVSQLQLAMNWVGAAVRRTGRVR
jgi:eukaryotic-like serine/threonine-protein kinase